MRHMDRGIFSVANDPVHSPVGGSRSGQRFLAARAWLLCEPPRRLHGLTIGPGNICCPVICGVIFCPTAVLAEGIMDRGFARIAEPIPGFWTTRGWMLGRMGSSPAGDGFRSVALRSAVGAILTAGKAAPGACGVLGKIPIWASSCSL